MKSVLAILKKNIMSLVCAIIALAAIVAVFFPIEGMFTELQGKMDERKKVYQDLTSLASKDRKEPITSADATESKSLGVFPTAAVINRGKVAIEQLGAQAKEISDTALKLNEHQLLVPGTLPNKPSLPVQSKYAKDYVAAIDFANQDETIRATTLGAKILEGSLPVSDQEIRVKQEEVANRMKSERYTYVNGVITNKEKVDRDVALELASFADEVRKQAALTAKMYVNAEAMDVYPGIAGNQFVQPTPMYFSQVGLWIQEDICKALAAANAGSKNVLDAPVKHVLKIDVTEESQPASGGAPSADGSVSTTPQSLSRRVSNADYLVNMFSLTLRVDAEKLPHVLTEICRNRFFTVLNVESVSSVDSSQAAMQGFYYGDRQVVEVRLRCEALLLRKWIEQYVPPEVKIQLGLAPPAAPVG